MSSDRTVSSCDHEFVTESEQIRTSLSPAHPYGAAPPEYEPVGRVCKKCGIGEKDALGAGAPEAEGREE